MGSELISGQRVGPYRLLFRLGKGGMGEVWAAQKASQFGFERLVALKLLRGVTHDSNAAVMFFDEARAAAALNHAAIVPTTDLGQYGDTFYIAMGMVRGPSLTAILQRLAVEKRPIPPAIVAYIGERIASALDYAYERAELDGKKLRLVHRDISPHNVLVDEEGNVMLSDFGVARTSTQEHESRVGTVRGKPSYMAPEQVRGGEMDARTDLFALGIVLYEAACVKRLFGRSNPVKSMDAVVSYDPKPLSTLVPDFPEPLWAVISKALEKEPDKRYASSSELARALAEVNRSLPGATTAARDFAQLIAEVFPRGSFDVEARVKEALAEDSAAEQPEALNEAQEATKYEPRKVVTAAFSEPVGTGAWPTAYAGPDPLDPEAIAEVQAQMAANRGPSSMFSATNSGSMPSFQVQSYPQVTGTRSTHKGRSSLIAAIAISAAALVVGVVVWVATSRPSEVTMVELDPEPPTPRVTPGTLEIGATRDTPSAAESPAATPQPTASARASSTPTAARPVAAATPSPSPSTVLVADTRRPSPRPSVARPLTPEGAGDPAPSVGSAPRAPLTPESVLALINTVPDRARASELRAALVEAGSDEGGLTKVRDAALRASARQPP